jgi:hypothetical protein
MAHPAVTAPIIGARNLDQLDPSLRAADINMTPEWRREISDLSIDPPLPTDRSAPAAQVPFAQEKVPVAKPALYRQAPNGTLYALGPDALDQRAALRYDPTNGTLSPGDIVLAK